MTIKELAQKNNITKQAIYKFAKELGRIPTQKEIEERHKKYRKGRPLKYVCEK